MILQLKDNGNLLEINEIRELIDPNSDIVHGQEQAGEEEQDPAAYEKQNLIFPSGEELPRCWLDANYNNATAA